MSSSSGSSSSHASTPVEEELAALALDNHPDADLDTPQGVLTVLEQRERPRLCPLRQPHDAELRDKIEAFDTTPAVRAGASPALFRLSQCAHVPQRCIC